MVKYAISHKREKVISSFEFDEDRSDESGKKINSKWSKATVIPRTVHQWKGLLEETTNALTKFWYADLPPFHGLLRIAFYGLMWTSSFEWFPLPRSGPHSKMFSVDWCERRRDGLLHFPNLGFQYNAESGIFGYFLAHVEDPSTFWLFNCNALVGLLKVGLILSILGVGWKIPRVIVAITYWIQLLIKQSTFQSKNTHSQLLGAFAFLVLCFAENNLIDKWSIDSFLLSAYRKWMGVGNGKVRRKPVVINGASAGAAPRKFVMCVAACAFFFAGLHKVSSNGLKWLDGATLYRAISTQKGHCKSLHNLFVKYRFLSIPLAISTVIGEIAVLFIIFPSSWWRPFGIATMYGFHLGVYLLMDPNFICHGIDYILIIDWQKFYNATRSGIQMLNEGNGATASTSPKKKPAPLLASEQDGRSSSLSSSSHSPETKIPTSWKVGSWIYTFLVILAFLAGIFRWDGLPFYSWCLYNHHPGDPLVTQTFTQQVAQDGAHRCMTTPPLNPACRHLGNTSHHDKWRSRIKGFSGSFAIMEDKKSPKCPLEVYENWTPVACATRDYSIPLSQQLDHLIYIATGSEEYEGKKRKGKKRKGKKRKPSSLPIKDIKSGVSRGTKDAIAAAIDEGSQCFQEDAEWKKVSKKWKWSIDRNLYNPASRFARQIRTHMAKPGIAEQYLGEGKELVAVALVLYYNEDPPNDDKHKACVLGTSMVGENVTRTFGNHEIGNVDQTFPRGDFTSAWTEVLLTILLCCATMYAPKFEQILALKGTASNRGHGFWSHVAARRRFYLFSLFVAAGFHVYMMTCGGWLKNPYEYQY